MTDARVDSVLLDAIRGGGPAVLTDLTLPPYDAEAIAVISGVLAGSCDAVLVGEHQDQPDFSPALMAGSWPRSESRPGDPYLP